MSNDAPGFQIINNAEVDQDGLIERAVIPLRDQVIYPSMVSPLPIFSQQSLEIVRAALADNQTLIALAERDIVFEKPTTENLYSVGTELALGQLMQTSARTVMVLAQGRRRLEIAGIVKTEPYLVVKARPLHDTITDAPKIPGLQQAVIDLFKHHLEFNDSIPTDVGEYLLNIDQPGLLADLIAATIEIDSEERQHILELIDVNERLEHIAILLGQQLSSQEMQSELNHQTQQEMARTQREAFLREQMRVIQTELGEMDIFQQELDELRLSIAQANLPEEIHTRALHELSRLAMMPPIAPETGIIRTYLDWIVELPWTTHTEDNLDIENARQTLDEDHHGLPKVKDRILEHIAVRKLAADKMKNPILCFVGPPGVGKTSVGKSIARALGREFVRVSLGGIRDESEIRGHRRTYIGAMPGRIIQTMRRAGTANPVFMLDEIDKLSADYRGDPSAALLEVLDREQNNAFSDHYLEVPFDLSQVMFIATANDLYPMSPALEDRLEIIEFTGYTEEEKIAISRQFLIPAQLEAHGLSDARIRFDTTALQTLIREYTYEAGVRNLDREIANILRKIARLKAEEKRHPKRITSNKVAEFLGPAQVNPTRANTEDAIGLVTGLVWTSGGGDIQTIEVSIVPGKGAITMTGQLGEVLQESAQTAMSYMRARATDLDVPHDDFENYDVHIHMPEGAVPKDGPSAGITLATAIISAFTERPVRANYAMTGEITLRGKVLPIGGVKEKVLAAQRNRIPNVILPAQNKKDLVDIPKNVLRSIKIGFVDDMQDVMDTILLDAPEERQRDKDKPQEESDSEAETTETNGIRKRKKVAER